MTIADISIVSIVSTVDMLLRVEATKWPLLSDWWNRMRQIPEYSKSNDEGLVRLKAIAQQSTDYPINI